MAKAAVRPTFESFLDRPSALAEKPKPLPTGTYLAVNTGLPRIDKSSKKQTEFSEYTLKILQQYDDVDEEALEAMGGCVGKTVRVTFYHTPPSEWRLAEFFDHLGIPQKDEDDDHVLTHSERMQMTPNRQVKVFIKHAMSDDGSQVYANVSKTAPVD